MELYPLPPSIQTTPDLNELTNLLTKYNLLSSNKKIRLIAGAIRNTGTGFALINDSEHSPIGINSVTNNTDKITINYDFTAKNVLGLVVVPDEIMAKNGIFVGASVGLSLSNIYVYKDYSVVGYITKSGGSSPVYTVDAALSRGVSAVNAPTIYTMRVTHDICDIPNYAIDNIHSRLTKVEPYVVTYGELTTDVRFRRRPKVFGALITSNGTAFTIDQVTGISTAVWDVGSTSLLVTCADSFSKMIPTVTMKDGSPLTAKIYSYDNVTGVIQIRFYDAAGVLVNAISPDMDIVLSVNEGTGVEIIPDDGVYIFEKQAIGKMDPSKLTYTGSNFWIFGVMEME